MPRPKQSVPVYRLHKSSGQACCYIDRQRVYLGVYGTAESKRRYSELIEKCLSTSQGLPPGTSGIRCTVNELLLKFATEYLSKYSAAEQRCLTGVIRVIRSLFGETPTNEFGPIKLRAVRTAMQEKGWSISFTNKQVKRLRLIFRIGVSWELVPQTVADALASVPSLEDIGSADRRRRAIPDEDLAAVRSVLTGRNRDIFDLLLLTGARSGELLGLTNGMIDRTGDIWRAAILEHKTRRHGKDRTLFFNHKAQAILQKYMTGNSDDRLFKIQRDSYGDNLKAACAKAGVRPFTPHWIRHTVATRLANEMGTESAQRLLGHATRAMTEHYSIAADQQAIEAAKRLG